MDKRKRWREEEERLVARWNAAALRYREVQAEISSQGAETEALRLKAQTAREEIEAVRREVARLKVEFNSGKRY
jgi:chromosome segregation ATPase